ncbi:MAG: proteasome accessory factor PafA2 family protein [Gemmatimonadetes bacterium]|nr:proteasome accessory factor PafA2 family protein [Gemmatimonadota bacterium]
MRLVMGAESEFGITAVREDGDRIPLSQLRYPLQCAIQGRVAGLRDGTDGGLFIPTGRMMWDCDHPELSTIEVESPHDVVIAMRAAEQLLLESMQDVAAAHDGRIELFRCNVDYMGGAAWAAHESYRHACPPAVLPPHLLPHLVTRVVYCGAGGLNPTDAGIEFTLSPKAWHFKAAVNGDSTVLRGIYHTRDEPLGGGAWHRLHVTCGESLCADEAMLLKLGVTALIVACVDAGLLVGDGLALANPVAALRAVAADSSCQVQLPLASGGRATAIEIQRAYLARVEAHRKDGDLPQWAGEICERWRCALDHLQAQDAWVSRTLDWGIKLQLVRQVAGDATTFRGFRRKNALWKWTRRRIQQALAQAQSYPRELVWMPERALEPNSLIPDDIDGIEARLAREGATVDEVREHVALRYRLAALDLRYGQLGPAGIYATLAAQGLVGGWRADASAIARARHQPPTGGRAAGRARAIAEVASGAHPHDGEAGWEHVLDEGGSRRAEFPDPLDDAVRWVSIGPQEKRARLRHMVRELFTSGRAE